MAGIVVSPRGHGTEVQAYLNKHKITKLFEDLLSKLVKELPARPVDFLISKLQFIGEKKKVVQPPSPGNRSKLQVSGSSVSPQTKIPTHGPAKPSSLRSPRAKTSVSSSTDSKLTPPSKPLRPSSSSIAKPGSRSTSRTPGSQLKPPSTTPIRPNTAPSNKRTPKLTSVNVSSSRSKLPATTQLKSPSSRRTGATKSTTTTPKSLASTTGSAKPKARSPSAPKVTKPVSEPVKPAPQPATTENEPLRETRLTSVEICDEDDEEFGGRHSGKREQERSETEEEGEESEGERVMEDAVEDLVLENIIKIRERSAHSKQFIVESLLATPTSTKVTPLSEGYGSEDGESGEEEEGGGVEMVEDYAAFEEEGVSVVELKKSKFAMREAPPTDGHARVDLKLQICSRCACSLAEGGEEGEGRDVTAMETVSMVTQVMSSEADCESASQVGSHASFPQWTGVSEASSDVTLQSHDTWGDIAPQPRTPLPPSDVESDVHLPPPPPLETQPWPQTDTHTQQDHFGWAQ